MHTKDFYFELPEELIAQHPLERREMSNMMTLSLKNGQVKDKKFTDFPGLLLPGDCLVLNDSRVLPARLLGVRSADKKPVELLLLQNLGEDVWECLVKPGKRCAAGTKLSFGDGCLRAKIEEVMPEGNRKIRFFYEGIFLEVLERLGEMPLPPYIREKLEEPERYQTVYAREVGSSAAPTAGLHFTPEILREIQERGVSTAFVTLHVGLGTFRPVKVDDIYKHKMHAEWYSISKETADTINLAKASGGRVICVGTTSCRTLESAADKNGSIFPGSGYTDIFIYPGYKFKILDALLTNFHLPESTLIMLISAFAGRENVLSAYRHAVEERYRFFSFGDCMFIY